MVFDMAVGCIVGGGQETDMAGGRLEGGWMVEAMWTMGVIRARGEVGE